jgi:hypothetical protein
MLEMLKASQTRVPSSEINPEYKQVLDIALHSQDPRELVNLRIEFFEELAEKRRMANPGVENIIRKIKLALLRNTYCVENLVWFALFTKKLSNLQILALKSNITLQYIFWEVDSVKNSLDKIIPQYAEMENFLVLVELFSQLKENKDSDDLLVQFQKNLLSIDSPYSFVKNILNYAHARWCGAINKFSEISFPDELAKVLIDLRVVEIDRVLATNTTLSEIMLDLINNNNIDQPGVCFMLASNTNCNSKTLETIYDTLYKKNTSGVIHIVAALAENTASGKKLLQVIANEVPRYSGQALRTLQKLEV